MTPSIWLTATLWPGLVAIYGYLELNFLTSLPPDASPKLTKMIGQWRFLTGGCLFMFGCMLLLQFILSVDERKRSRSPDSPQDP